ncbi:MAG: PKD domain-containing protein [Alistipes sp.]
MSVARFPHDSRRVVSERFPAHAAGGWAVSRDRGRLTRGNRPESKAYPFRGPVPGKIEKRRWNFGDGTGSDDPCPVHCYPKAGEWTVTLYVEGPDGSDRRIKVWEVVTK